MSNPAGFVIYENSLREFTYRPPPGLGAMDAELHHEFDHRGHELGGEALLGSKGVRPRRRTMMQNKTGIKRRYKTGSMREFNSLRNGEPSVLDLLQMSSFAISFSAAELPIGTTRTGIGSRLSHIRSLRSLVARPSKSNRDLNRKYQIWGAR